MEKVYNIDCTNSWKSHFILAADWVDVCDRWIAARVSHQTPPEVVPRIWNRLKGLWDVKRLWMWVSAGSLWRPRASGCPSELRFPLQAWFIRTPLIGSVKGRLTSTNMLKQAPSPSGGATPIFHPDPFPISSPEPQMRTRLIYRSLKNVTVSPDKWNLLSDLLAVECFIGALRLWRKCIFICQVLSSLPQV